MALNDKQLDLLGASCARDRLHQKLMAAKEGPLVLDRSEQVDLRLVLDVFTAGVLKLCENIQKKNAKGGA